MPSYLIRVTMDSWDHPSNFEFSVSDDKQAIKKAKEYEKNRYHVIYLHKVIRLGTERSEGGCRSGD